MKIIQLTKGQATFIDDEDFEKINQHKWCVTFIPTYANGGKFVAMRTEGKTTILLHRFLLNAIKGQIVDHIDGNPLNNQRSNLRFATRSQNGANNANILRSDNKSGFRGVSWHKQHLQWKATISKNGKLIHLGYFDDIHEAAKIYNEAANKYHREFATLNIVKI